MHTGNNALTVQQEMALDILDRESLLRDIQNQNKYYNFFSATEMIFIKNIKNLYAVKRFIYIMFAYSADSDWKDSIARHLKIGSVDEQILRANRIMQSFFEYCGQDKQEEVEAYLFESCSFIYYISDHDHTILGDVLKSEGIHI